MLRFHICDIKQHIILIKNQILKSMRFIIYIKIVSFKAQYVGRTINLSVNRFDDTYKGTEELWRKKKPFSIKRKRQKKRKTREMPQRTKVTKNIIEISDDCYSILDNIYSEKNSILICSKLWLIFIIGESRNISERNYI